MNPFVLLFFFVKYDSIQPALNLTTSVIPDAFLFIFKAGLYVNSSFPSLLFSFFFFFVLFWTNRFSRWLHFKPRYQLDQGSFNEDGKFVLKVEKLNLFDM